MTIYPLSQSAGTMIRFPSKAEVRAMLDRPAVFITAVLSGLVAFLSVLMAVVYLVATGHDTSAVTGLVGGSVIGIVLQLRSSVKANAARLDDIHADVKQASAAAGVAAVAASDASDAAAARR